MIYSSLCFILQNKWLEKKRNATFLYTKKEKSLPNQSCWRKKKKKTGNIAQIWDFYQRLGNIKSALVLQFFFFS